MRWWDRNKWLTWTLATSTYVLMPLVAWLQIRSGLIPNGEAHTMWVKVALFQLFIVPLAVYAAEHEDYGSAVVGRGGLVIIVAAGLYGLIE